jgi:hypothetical protein
MSHAPVDGALQWNILQSTRDQGRVAICRKIFRKMTNVYRKNISIYTIISRLGSPRTASFRHCVDKTDISLSLVSQERSVSRWQTCVQR